jgi:hypothetical protein
MAEHDEDYVGQMIRFMWFELLELCEMYERHLAQSERGRKRKLRPIDQLSILLVSLASGLTFRAIATVLLLSKSLVQRVIGKCLVQLDGKFDSLFPRSSQSVQCNIVLTNYPRVFGVVDASPVFINCPTRYQDQHYSGKYERYCIKIQVLVVADGQCVHCSEVSRWRTHDKALFVTSGGSTELGQSSQSKRRIEVDGQMNRALN